MGQIRFRVYDRQRISSSVLDGIYMCGTEEIPWQCRVYWEEDVLTLERLESESGRVHVPWKRADGSILYAETSTLAERDEPYLLEVELARGLIFLIRQQLAIWEPAGLSVDAGWRERFREASRKFFRAATAQHEFTQAGRLAGDAIEAAQALSAEFANMYCQQAIAIRRRATPKLPTLLGIDLGPDMPRPQVVGEIGGAFNLASVPCTWRQLESQEGQRDWSVPDAQIDWATRTGMKICAGPLIRLDSAGVPDWMYLWEGDFPSLVAFMLDHVRAVVDRYRGRVHLWHVAARVNSGRALSLIDDQRLRIVAEAVELLRQIDPRTPVVASFDRPWGEYMAQEDRELFPLHFADALVRADVGLAGFGLEIAPGYWPAGSFHRLAVSYGRLIDKWTTLGLPLLMLVSTPSSAAEDSLAKSGIRVVGGEGQDADALEVWQQQWIERVVPLALAKNSVQVIAWNQLDDSAPHERPNGGLFRRDGTAKPALESLRQIRRNYLM